MAISNIVQDITIPPPPPTGLYDVDFQDKVNALLNWYNIHAGEETYFIEKLNVMIVQLNEDNADKNQIYENTLAVYDNTVTIYNNTVVLKNEVQQIKEDVLAYVSSTYGSVLVIAGWDDATDFQDKTTHHNGSWWVSSTAGANINSEPGMTNSDWFWTGVYRTEVTMTEESYSAVCGNYIKVDPTAIVGVSVEGTSVAIVLPADPVDRCTITILNMDEIRITSLRIERGNTDHKIIGVQDDATMNCLCEKTLVFESTTQNWIEG